MSDDSIVAFLLAVCLMFFGIGVTPLFVGKRGRILSIVLCFPFLIAALDWSNIKAHVGPDLHGSLSAAASNAYIWLALLGATWVYFAASNLIQMPRRKGTYQEPRGPHPEPPKPPLPDSLQADFGHLTKTLLREPTWEKYKAQILYSNNDKCARLAKEFSQVLKDANWEEVSPPTLIGPDVNLPKGVSVRSSRSQPSANARTRVLMALNEIGIDPDWKELPELRSYDYCFVYFVE
jgi:hypothetical protein